MEKLVEDLELLIGNFIVLVVRHLGAEPEILCRVPRIGCYDVLGDAPIGEMVEGYKAAG